MYRLCIVACSLAGTTGAIAAPRVPKECGASVRLPNAEPSITAAHFVGTVKSIARKAEPSRFAIVVSDAAGDHALDLYIVPAKVPFKVGDAIDASLRRGGGWHRVYDALIKDKTGRVLLVASGSGADDWADGWTVTTGKVVKSEQRPNAKQQSVSRTHALDFARGKTKATVDPERCTLLQDGTSRYIVSGFGISWVGLRPPEVISDNYFCRAKVIDANQRADDALVHHSPSMKIDGPIEA